MMDFALMFKALLQGVVEGITEFLPISSTGHMILLDETFLKMDKPFADMFEIVVQLGAILSVVVYFHKKIFDDLFRFDFKSASWQLWFRVLTAVVPALVLGAIFGKYIKSILFNPIVVAVMLVLGGIALLILESPKYASRRAANADDADIDKMSFAKSFKIGIVQCLAMIPGTSRSAATIIGAMCFGCSRKTASEFSFFLAIPTMVAASGYALLTDATAMTGREWLALAVGFIVAFLVAFAVIAGFMKYIQSHDFRPFAYYRIALGAVILLCFAFHWL